jgi:hypothetical protein
MATFGRTTQNTQPQHSAWYWMCGSKLESTSVLGVSRGAHFAGNRLPGNSITDFGIYRFGNRLLIDSVTDIGNRIDISGNMIFNVP